MNTPRPNPTPAHDLRSVLDAVLDGIVVLDSERRIDVVNAEACRVLEISAETARGTVIDSLLSDPHPLVDIVRRVQKSGRSSLQDELDIGRRRAEDLVVDVAVSPLSEGRGGGGDGIVMVLRDRTISKSLRERVDEREKLTSYGHIAAGIAHEVKNPLGGIRGAAELIGRWSEDERTSNAAELIMREVDRISGLVEELMVFARGDELDERSVNLHWVLDSVIELIRMDPLAEGITIERVYDPSIPELFADADRLRQIFINLMRNALQAMEEQPGTLSIETRMTLDHRLANHEGRSGPTVEIRIRDTGSGIEPEILDRLTTPFFTTRTQGTGLGLAVSRHWISRHNGTLRIASRLGEGTTVHVQLPLDNPKSGAGHA